MAEIENSRKFSMNRARRCNLIAARLVLQPFVRSPSTFQTSSKLLSLVTILYMYICTIVFFFVGNI